MIQPISTINLNKNHVKKGKNKSHSYQFNLNPVFTLSNFPKSYVSFSGHINSFNNYRNNFEAIRISDKIEPSLSIDKTITPVEYAKRSINKIFKQDRDILDYDYLDNKSTFDRFSKLGYVEDLMTQYEDLTLYIEKTNERKLSKEYSEFFNKTLKSLEKVAKGQYKYTELFSGKKIGNQNLVDFWIDKLGENNKTKNKNKIDLLNDLLMQEYKQKGNVDNLAESTIVEYFRNKMQPLPKNDVVQSNIEIPSNLIEIKEKLSIIFTADEKNQKILMKEFVQNKTFLNEKINGIKLNDLLLYPLSKEDENIIDASDEFKKEILEEIIDDNILRKTSVENALTILRKNLLLMKASEEKQKQASILMKNEDLKNFDKSLLSVLFSQNKKEKTIAIIKDIKLFEKEANELFNQIIIKEPFTIKDNNESVNNSINVILSLINNILFSAEYNNQADKVLSKLSELSKTLYMDKDLLKANGTWKEIVKMANKEWQEKHIPLLIKSKQEDYLTAVDFLKETMSTDLARTGIVGTFFNSDIVTIEEKAFLAKKSKLNEFVSFAKFLSEHVPGNNERKKIIDTLMDKEKFNIELFDEIKETFIMDVRAQKIDSLAINNQININNVNKSFCDLVLEQFPNNENINQFSSTKSKINYLNKLTDEDLSVAFDNLKDSYLKDKFMDNCQLEVVKYDMGSQFDSVIKNLQIEYNGKKMNLFDFIDADFSILARKIDSNDNLTQGKLDSLMKNLYINNQNTKEIHQVLMLLLDRMEKANPNNREFVENMRTDTDRLFSGVGKGLLASSGGIIMAIALQNYAYLLTSVVPMFLSVNNEFNKGGMYVR